MIRLPSRINVARLAIIVIGAVVLLGVVQSIFAGESEFNVDGDNRAKNLARMNCGAQIDCITPDGNITRVSAISSRDAATAALIMEDQTISRALQNGETIFIVALPRVSLVNRFSFVNENAAASGNLTLSVSNYRLPAKSSKWAQIESTISFTGQRVCNISIPAVEAKYVRLSFHVKREGRIAALGLYGEETLDGFGDRQGHVTRAVHTSRSARLEDVVNFNFANLYAKARVVYVSSGPLPAARRMIDDDTSTSFRFSETDPHPTVILELADRERLHRATALYKMQSGRLDVYVMDELPSPPGDLSHLRPIASVTDVSGSGKAAVDFATQGARYVALRWTPQGLHGQRDAFEVAEVGAFGDVPISLLNVTQSPTLFAENVLTTVTEPIDPPVLPPVSP